MRRTLWTCIVAVLVAAAAAPTPAQAPSAGLPPQAPSLPPDGPDEETLRDAGLTADGPSLLAFFRTRANATADVERLRLLVRQFSGSSRRECGLAAAELLGWGPLALPVLRGLVNDCADPEVLDRARHCLRWLEGPSSAALPAAAARALGKRKPEGAAGALLAYVPYADNRDVAVAVAEALSAVATVGDKPDPALVHGLEDKVPARRAAACVALCAAGLADQAPGVRKLLDDPSPAVRLRAALAQARAREAAAVPVLIDLLADLPADQRQPVEEFLEELAGEWAPAVGFHGEDEIARRIRRDAWAGWWRNTDGPALLAALRKHVPSPADLERFRGLIRKLGSDMFDVRERATADLAAAGRPALPLLRAALKSKDVEVSRRAESCIRRIEHEPAHSLPLAAIRLLALRKPADAVEGLLTYLPYAEDDDRTEEVHTALAALARRGGRPDPALVRALADDSALRRAAAGAALARAGGAEARAAVRKLLADADLGVRLRVARALVAARDREAVPVLIDLVAALPAEKTDEVLSLLSELAGDKAPAAPEGDTKEARQKYRDAWAAWWKADGARVDLARVNASRPLLGYTVMSDIGRNVVFEVGRDGKPRWEIMGVVQSFDVHVLPRKRVLIAEWNTARVTERDFKGNILWEKKDLGSNPCNVQRLPNGNTFIATRNRMLEVNRAGKEIYSIPSTFQVEAAYRAPNGDILCLQGGACVRYNTRGKELSRFSSGRNNGEQMSGLDLLPNGHILITQVSRGKVVEFDARGKEVLSVDAPNVTTAVGLSNGHILAASYNTQRVFELDRKGKVVWEHKGHQVYRARRR